jgi:Na+/melibiose symporter-like transporter
MNIDVQHYEVIAVSWMAAATIWAVVSVIAFTLAFLLIPEEHAEAVPARATPKPAAEPTREPVRSGVSVGMA